MGFYSPRTLLNEVRRIGIGILPPDIHLSGKDFTVEDGEALRVGLTYCKGLSRAAISSTLFERRKKPFISVADLCRRTLVERDSLENLIRGGFLDTLSDRGVDRLRLLGEVGDLPKKRPREHQPEIPAPHPASWWSTRENGASSTCR